MSEAQEFCPLKSCCPKMESFDISFPTKTPHIYDMYMYIYIFAILRDFLVFILPRISRVSSPFMNFKALVWLPPIYYGIQRLRAWGTSIKSCFSHGFSGLMTLIKFFYLGNITHFVVLRKN